MPAPYKPVVVSLVAAVTLALGTAPASAFEPSRTAWATEAAPVSISAAQTLNTVEASLTTNSLASLLTLTESAHASHNFDVEATIAAAKSEIGTSRATGWNQQGECIMSVQRWIRVGGGAWTGGGDPIANYTGALRLSLTDVKAGDVIQYEHLTYPTSWVSGIHTVLVVGVNDDGTLSIVESNNPAGSGLVTATARWTPKPPTGFQAVVWRF